MRKGTPYAGNANINNLVKIPINVF